ncbi:hypothetical protein EYS14_18945 [Alteromonadaceae bacterium M269]|nr:hypothetical protein EYS14_18945 [Alteromonadaceae bacterium M269]
MNIKRLMINLCSKNLEESKSFYTSLFAFKVSYDSDWFIHLISEESQLELGIIAENHDIVPEQARGQSSGMYLTFVVEDVDELFQKVKSLNYDIIQEPEDTFYGQRRTLVLAPEGTVCDISSPT